MKVLLFSLLLLPLCAFAHDDNDACKAVFEACAAQGFTKDETAPAGQKIWLNCANIIINQKKSVPKVELDPNAPIVNYCRHYNEAKEKFDTEWNKMHKKPE